MRSLIERARALRATLADFDPALLSVDDCSVVVDELARLEKSCAAAKARAAMRASFDAAGLLAQVSGSSSRAAQSALEVVAGSERCPETSRAVATGELSTEQAHEIVKTEAESPGSEDALLAIARTSSLSKLRDEARKLRHAAIGVDEVHKRQLAARRFRHWRNDIGNVAFAGELPPEVGVPFVNRLDRACDRVRREAKRAGDVLEVRDAYAADAFAQLVSSSGTRAGSSVDAVVVIDLRAWRRGHAHEGEPCHVVGGGNIPVDVAKAMAGDAFLKAVVHDGVEIKTVKHFGRYRKAELETALNLGPLPELDGVTCVEQGCERKYHLQWDHIDPVANGGPTMFSNLAARCWEHHQAKTDRDRRAGLLRGCP